MCGKTGFLMLQLPLIALSIVRRVKHLITYCMVLINVCPVQPRPDLVYSLENYAKCQLNVFTRVHAAIREKLQASRAEMIYRQCRIRNLGLSRICIIAAWQPSLPSQGQPLLSCHFSKRTDPGRTPASQCSRVTPVPCL